MSPQAIILSQARGRTRVKVPERARDPDYFQSVGSELGRCPGVERVMTNPLTGSILMIHEAPLDHVTSYAADHDLFRVENRTRSEADDRDHAAVALQRLAQVGSRPLSPEMSAFAGATLLGLAAYQATRGKFLPAGMTLVFQALDIVRSHSNPSPAPYMGSV